jgi:Tol biopolymer transport system component
MIGTKLAHYEITKHLGSGGMGDVYQATDLKLDRSVAIKLLPEAFSHDNERVARFAREARVLASLNHPHIGAIYGLEESGGRNFLVMELVGGKTLADQIKRGPIPLDEALGIAKQIAEALEAAHEKGIIHRDLKPGNVMITPSGQVKVLDFGLAKVRHADGHGASLSNSPTMMTADEPGMILGTAAYMSPEQTKGSDADRTADIWAFGCVLYEMLTGRALFRGETIGEILACVLKTDPDWSRLPAETPPGIRRLLRRCLQKDRKLRFHSMTDVRIEIVDAPNEIPADGHSGRAALGRMRRAGWISALAIVSLIAVVAIVLVFRPVPSGREMRVDISTPPTRDPQSIAISPDGRKIVFAGIVEGQSRLWLRSLDSASARVLAGTDDALAPFWSPDSRSIGFFTHGKLERLDIDSGSTQILANAGFGRGGTWNREGAILFTPNPGSPILRVAVTGGEPTAVTRVEAPQQFGHAFPQFLPDGRHFLYYVLGSPQAHGVYVGELDQSEPRRLLDADAAAVYASSGHLLFVRQDILFAQEFDPVRLDLAGNPFPVTERMTVQDLSAAALSASGTGSILFRTSLTLSGQRQGQLQFIWFDRAGLKVREAGSPEVSQAGGSLSPDGHRVALFRPVGGNVDIWLLETLRGVSNRFTFDTADDIFPIWSPDGARIAFSSNRNGGVQNLYQKSASGAGSEDLLLATPRGKTLTDWSSDGRFLLYMNAGAKTGFDIWTLPLSDRNAFPIIDTDFDEQLAQFSPDGTLIAYQSNESGRFEIYLQPFSGPNDKPAAKLRISTNGGAQARWRHDGKELFYIDLEGRLMAVPIHGAEPGAPVPLFVTRVSGALQPYPRYEYMVSSDGQRFLVNTMTGEASTSPITLILNWNAKPLAK